MSLQNVAAANHSLFTGRVTSLRDRLQTQIALSLLQHFYENFCFRDRILSPQQVAQTQSDLIFFRLIEAARAQGPVYMEVGNPR